MTSYSGTSSSNKFIDANQIWETTNGTLVATGTRHVIIVDINKKQYDREEIVYYKILGDNKDYVYSNFRGYFTQNVTRPQ